MRHAKFFSLLVFVVLFAYGAVAFYFLPLATFQGELTRMGLLPESLFSATKPQPALDAKWMQQSSMQEADVLVIGDSFSLGRVWQTVLTQQGLKVRTESWESMRGICADFMPWIRAQGFAGKYVLIESIERSMMERLSDSLACQQMQYHPALTLTPAKSLNANPGDYGGKLSTGIQTRLNVWKYERLSGSADFKSWLLPNDVKMARVTNGCELFSHARCNDALFLSYDKSEEVDASALDNIGKLTSRLNGVTPIWVFVPNKSTAYLYPDKKFWSEAESRYHSPNLLRMTQQAIAQKTVDLYPANNTHFSTSGYLLMGEEIFKTMRQTQAENRPR